jgi:hypothetical protein
VLIGSPVRAAVLGGRRKPAANGLTAPLRPTRIFPLPGLDAQGRGGDRSHRKHPGRGDDLRVPHEFLQEAGMVSTPPLAQVSRCAKLRDSPPFSKITAHNLRMDRSAVSDLQQM